ncbi:MAG: hypothetical protein QOF63_1218 [Thermoanaerobaculia bacterium]|jgi:hypothetical protein|nr:hypothetical protein [Thermoanaerobaculia bacterium]
MNLRNRILNNPCTLMMIGMTCFVLGNPPSFIHIATKMNGDAFDFARGFLIGLSIGFNLLAAWMHGQNMRCAR